MLEEASAISRDGSGPCNILLGLGFRVPGLGFRGGIEGCMRLGMHNASLESASLVGYLSCRRLEDGGGTSNCKP